ncbi:hypothetical protein BH11PSE5_BH11PSE5_19140 [soil metagenome]|jgi:hypothetical protein|uniref:hypothetical protein n=1 Tax=unclassified Sphingobium TaxID=2611147 RepID=UPI001E3B3BC6|nr:MULTISPECIES: hypothetical protein [unclassified Sphingobium]GLI97100.1 hypothetical protein Sbs19_09180 [Sphingobium sp. BS19]CAH0349309.1 hypothetical protein SPH9361_00541 [Sphingobium sp. CECT 9361]|tara:strand:- start:500 stop:688 length:189 start_codon:yes stop_codon:yes gene_type:complete
MIEFAALTYGVLASFVLTSAGRNRAKQQPHPPMVQYVGYMLCGVSAGASAILSGIAIHQLMA